MIAALVAGLLLPQVVHLRWPFQAHEWRPLEWSSAHQGDDRFAQDWIRIGSRSDDEPLVAPLSGIVIQAEWTCSGYGRTIVIYDPERELAVRLAHLASLEVAAGDTALAGVTRIGTVGKSGPRSDCPNGGSGPWIAHAHISVYRHVRRENLSGQPINSVEIGRRASPFAAAFLLVQ